MNVPHSLELLENRIAPAGLVLMEYNEKTGELILTGDDAPNAIEIFQVAPGTFRIEGKDDAGTLTKTSIGEDGNGATTIKKLTSLTINLGGGNDEVDLANLRSLKSLVVNTGIGNDSVKGYNVTSLGSVSFDTGAGSDGVKLSGLSTVIGRDLVINDSEGGLIFELGAASAKIGGQVLFAGGSGSDSLVTESATNLTIGKTLSFNGGLGGNNSIKFGNQGAISIGKSPLGQSILYTGGAGADSISIGANRVTIQGSVEMDGGGGADLLDLDGVTVSVGKSRAGISVLLAGGVGNDEIDIQGGSVKLAGSLTLDGGSDADFLDLSNLHMLTVGGAIELNGAAGADLLTLEAGILRLASSLKVLGGDDTDRVSIEADGYINGSVELLLGGAVTGVQDVEIRGLSGLTNSLKVQGGLKVDSAGAAAADRFRLTNVTIAKTSSMIFGDATSDVDIDNLSVAAPLTIDTRGGADNVRIERDAVYGSALFRQATTILLGEGDDVLQVGKDSSNNRVSVLASLTVDGGEGADSRNDIENSNQFGAAAFFTSGSFEVEDLAN